MRIGILTYFGDLNFGTNLQAYSTMMSVQKAFPEADVEIVPIHSFKNVNRPYLSNATPMSLYRDFVRIHKYSKFVDEELHVKNDVIIKETQAGLDFIGKRNYDRIYVGADTLLELDRHEKAGFDDLTFYWLGNSISSKQYLLAASSKNAFYSTLTPLQKEQLAKYVPNYSGIYVRDTPSKDLVCNFVESDKVKIIPDPTFAYDIDYKYADDYVKRKNLDLSNSILIHGYRDDSYLSGFVKLAKKRGYTIASLRPARWADIEINDVGPREHAGIFKYFKCVITHRFHDTVFCLKNNTPVVVSLPAPNLADEKGKSKHSTLLDFFGLTELCLTNDKFTITADSLLKNMEDVMENWDKMKILPILDLLRDDYLSAIEETK
ncbi:MAG: polysaccharide pyruvyl transferase family protein [Bacteroidaceae bacterium]|nr:polysaccharide pyruvyl transferase family protein [Bacteroidaceae bacterium]